MSLNTKGLGSRPGVAFNSRPGAGNNTPGPTRGQAPQGTGLTLNQVKARDARLKQQNDSINQHYADQSTNARTGSSGAEPTPVKDFFKSIGEFLKLIFTWPVEKIVSVIYYLLGGIEPKIT